MFGFLAAVRKKLEDGGGEEGRDDDDDPVFDLALVAYRTDYRVKSGIGEILCGCCTSKARK